MITIVIPVLNEEHNIPALLKEISAVAAKIPLSEVIYVDDGSTDATFAVLQSLKNEYPFLRVIRHLQRSGQSAALWTGVKAAANEMVVTLDGDGQNDPADIEILYNVYKSHHRQFQKIMVAGERKRRNDVWIKRVSSRLANKIRCHLLKDNTRDTGCSLKLFRRRDYLALPYFDHMHRFLPALMLRDRVHLLHVPVSHRARLAGTSKYGTLDRLAVGIGDLCGVLWLSKRSFTYPEISEDLSENA